MLNNYIKSIMLVGCVLNVVGCTADYENADVINKNTDVPGGSTDVPDESTDPDPDPDPDPDVDNGGDPDVGLTPMAFESGNGLLPTCFWSPGAQKTLRALGKGPLANASGTMPSMTALLPLCYDVIKYAVQCALDSSESVTNPHTGAVYEGSVGLAPNWRTQALDSDGRRWVTACMVQRLNVLGLKVPILIEGDHSPLYESTELDYKYPFQESSAFGDLFSSTAPLTGLAPAFTAYMCAEEDLTNTCLNLTNLLNIRVCDNVGLLCGMKFIGKCSEKCSANGPYWSCPNYGFSQTIRIQTQDNLCL